jgi:hypothetical protein
MTVVSTQFKVPMTRDLAILAAQDIVDQRGWRVLSVSSTEIVVQERDYDMLKGQSPKLTASFVERGNSTEISVNASIFGAGPLMKKVVTGFMGQFVNSLSLRTQTNSIAINPTVQVGEGQGGQSVQGSAPTDRIELLKQAKELFDAGVLSDEEFQAEKTRLLSQ